MKNTRWLRTNPHTYLRTFNDVNFKLFRSSANSWAFKAYSSKWKFGNMNLGYDGESAKYAKELANRIIYQRTLKVEY